MKANPSYRCREGGFTLVEIVVVLIILGVLAVVASSRIGTITTDATLSSQTGLIKNTVRYAQSLAMKASAGDTSALRGVKCDGTDYWLFRNNAPDTPANQIPPPGESAAKVTLAAQKVTMSAFVVIFDGFGRPYTSYTNQTTNTPVSAANPVMVTINSVPAGAPVTFGISPETGFIP
jgi:prepilin-type N-terminal cleavage/methylation domain-containing protein